MKMILLLFALFASVHALAAQTHSVTLTWAPGSGGGAVSSFMVQRGLTTGGPYTTICGVNGQPACPTFTSGVATYAYIDSSGAGNVLQEGTTYFYIVKATGPGGQSSPSNEVKALIPFLLPSAPTGLQATTQ